MKKILSIALILAIVMLPMTAYAFPPSDDDLIPGIDVSKWQGTIDFERVKADGVQAVYIRSSLGMDYVDPYFEKNYQKAKAAGLSIGFYHYVTATTVTQARAQAHFFLSTIAGTEPDMRLAVDYERYDTAAQANEIALAFIDEVERLSGMEVVLYSDASHARTIWSQQVADRVPIWVAEYGVTEPRDNGKWSTWVGFQYTSSGRVDGINGNVDRDWFTRGIFLSDSGNVPEPEPDEHGHLIQITVKRGDTLSRIAQQYNTTVRELARLNQIANVNRISVGQVLLIPVSHDSGTGTKYITYTVRRGDALYRIARRYGTTVDEIVKLNGIANPDRILVGQKLRIPVENYTTYTYTVQPGDTLNGIAQRFQMDINKLAAINDIADINQIPVGMELEIHSIRRG